MMGERKRKKRKNKQRNRLAGVDARVRRLVGSWFGVCEKPSRSGPSDSWEPANWEREEEQEESKEGTSPEKHAQHSI